jgi:diguanylate cyclase (GGDEF)-like protein
MAERILLVEDNKSLAKLISMKIAAALPFEVDIAYSFKEAALFSRKFDYFVALLDLNLPDAPNGEVVDMIIDQGIRSLVLSGNMNKEVRRSLLEKEIIDYVSKGGMDDINYITASLERLTRNRDHKVLIVDPSMQFRSRLQKMLKNLFFNVFAVAHGEEALGILKENPDIALVLTDYKMPVMDGLELTKEIRKAHPKNALTIIAMSSSDDDDISAMFLKSGATDYIKKGFSKEEFSCRINNAIEALENIQTITRSQHRDRLTGLYNRAHMLETQSGYISKARDEHEHFAVAAIAIDGYESIASQYGLAVAEEAVVQVSEILRINTTENDFVAHFGAEVFSIILKACSSDQALETFEQLRHRVSVFPVQVSDDEVIRPTISIGVALDSEGTLEECVDNADLLLYQAKNDGGDRVASSH